MPLEHGGRLCTYHVKMGFFQQADDMLRSRRAHGYKRRAQRPAVLGGV